MENTDISGTKVVVQGLNVTKHYGIKNRMVKAKEDTSFIHLEVNVSFKRGKVNHLKGKGHGQEETVYRRGGGN